MAILLRANLYLVVANCSCAYAQVATGQISGRVFDPSGAALPNTAVSVLNTLTGTERKTISNAEGFYGIPFLPPGVYRVTALREGFRPAARSGVKLDVGDVLILNITLPLWPLLETLQVTGELPQLDLESASAGLGMVVREQQAKDLPLNGRNFTQLLTLTAGVVSLGTSSSWGNPQMGSFTLPSINGQSVKSTQWLLDGANNSSPAFALISIAPVIDDIEEFKLISHADSAEYGGVLGGVVSVISKGGTNEPRGTLWEFLRNDKLDARNFFKPDVSPLRQNQFGGNLGGPVYLGRLYDGRNRTFFHASYQGSRQSFVNSGLYRVPTPAEMSGDLRHENPVYDPFSTRTDPNRPGQLLRDPFPGNVIPADRIDPVARQHVARLYPLPIDTGFPGTNGISSKPDSTTQDLWSLRGDQQFRASSLSARYNGVKTPVVTAGYGGLAGSTMNRESHGYNAAVNYTWTLNSASVFHLLFSRSFIDLLLTSKADSLDESNFVPKLYSESFACGFLGGFGPGKCYLPFLDIPGFAGVGEFQGRVGQTDIWEVKPDFAINRGRHNLKVGFGYAQHKLWALTQRAAISYSASQTSDLQNPASTGSALASFLLGVPSGAERADSADSMLPARLYGFFFQDQWRLGKRLTLNLGLRYDANILPNFGDPGFFGSLKVENEYSGNLDLLRGRYLIPRLPPPCSEKGRAPCMPTPDGSLPPHVELAPGGRMFRNIYDNWQPRLGLAFALRRTTILRAGAGRYFDNWNETTLAAAQQEGLWPDVRRVYDYQLNLTTVRARSNNPLVSVGTLPQPSPFYLTTLSRDPRMKNPQSDQFNIGIEQEVVKGTIVSAHYVGSRGRRIPTGSLWNSAVLPGPGDPVVRRPYPYINPASVMKDWSRNWYDAFQLAFERKFNHGLGIVATYTRSKSLDLGSSDGVGGTAQDPYNLWLEKGSTNYDLPQVASIGWSYELPVGESRGYRTRNKQLDSILAGWQINGMAQFTSGMPYGVTVCGDGANVGRSDCYLRPNLIGNPAVDSPGPSQWFNPQAFAAPPQFAFGSLARNSLRGQPSRNVDLSLFRTFSIRERIKLQLRVEAFNVSNTTTFANPDSTFGDSNVGRIFATRSVERQVQVGLKLQY